MTTPYCILHRWRGYKESSLFLFILTFHDDVIQLNYFPRYWPFVRGITSHRLIPLTKAELCFFLIYAWTNGWANTRYAGDLRGHRVHYDVTTAFPERESNHYLDQRWHSSPRFLGHGWLVASPSILCITEWLGHYWLKIGLIGVMAS